MLRLSDKFQEEGADLLEHWPKRASSSDSTDSPISPKGELSQRVSKGEFVPTVSKVLSHSGLTESTTDNCSQTPSTSEPDQSPTVEDDWLAPTESPSPLEKDAIVISL